MNDMLFPVSGSYIKNVDNDKNALVKFTREIEIGDWVLVKKEMDLEMVKVDAPTLQQFQNQQLELVGVVYAIETTFTSD